MLIILEGPDRAGKSTLAREISRHLKDENPLCSVEMLHRGPPRSHPLDEYERPLWTYRPGRDQHVICDRWHVGEIVYPPVIGRSSQLTAASLWHIELFLQSRGALLVHVSAPVETLVTRTLEEQGTHRLSVGELNNVARVRARFVNAVRLSRVPTVNVLDDLIFDGRARAGDDAVVEQIVKSATRLAGQTRRLNDFTTYVGPPNPQILLLGDVRKRANDDPTGPAFVPYGATSGAYMLDALQEVMKTQQPRGNELSWLGLGNACDADDPMALWETLDRPRVVLLGRNAALAVEGKLRAAGATVRTVDHPQYVRRFKHSAASVYASQILSVGQALSWS